MVDIAAPSAAASRSASSQTIFADLPPSSIVCGMILVEAYCISFLAVGREPVHPTGRTRGSVASGSPTSGPEPVTILSRPGGSRSAITLANAGTDGHTITAGLGPTVLPAAKAG